MNDPDHDQRYMLATVDLLTVKARLERILNDSKEHALVPSIELMSACISDLTHAMIYTHRARLSDPRYKEICCQLCARMKCEFCREP